MARIKGIRLKTKRKRNTNNNVGDSNSNMNSGNGSRTSSDSEEVIPAGFIFLCNNKTKSRCFQYHVFGLSMSQKRSVEKIMPGTRLFLFDYEMRLLHGVYEAVSQGELQLVPHAFQGKYLAQVKFRILGNCFPLQEKCFKSAILENYRSGRLRLELSEQQVNKLVSLFHQFPVPTVSSSPSFEHGELMRLSNAASPYSSLPQTRENEYYNKNFDRLHSLQNMQHQPTASAILDHVQHHQNILNQIQLQDHELYSTRGHTMSLQEPYHSTRHITGQQEWFPQNQAMGLANDYDQLPFIMRDPGHSFHSQENDPTWYHDHQETDPTWYHHHHQVPFLGENSTRGENLPAFADPNSSLSTMHQPHDLPYAGCHELPYLVTGPDYVSSAVIPPTYGVVLPQEQTYSFPTTNYNVPNTAMHSSSYVPAPSTVWPEQNYPTMLAAAAEASYASPSVWLDRNPPISTAPNNYNNDITMQSHAPPLSGMPPLPPNVPISSLFSFVGSENPSIN